jgi:tetratricopeptide (TPR) repeat protein
MLTRLILPCSAVLLLSGCLSSNSVPKETQFILKEALSAPDSQDRWLAVNRMGLTSVHPPFATIPVLIKAMDDRDPTVSKAAQEMLEKLTGQTNLGSSSQIWAAWWEKGKVDFQPADKSGATAVAESNAAMMDQNGRTALLRGNPRAAEEFFREAISKDPGKAGYRNNLGLALFHQGDYQSALERFKEAVQLDKNLGEGYMNIGNCYQEMGADYWSNAASAYDKTIECDTRQTNSEVYHQYARLHKRIAWRLGDRINPLPDAGGRTAAREREEARRLCVSALEIMHTTKADLDPFRQARTRALLVEILFSLDRYYVAAKEIGQIEDLGLQVVPEVRASVLKALRDRDPEGYAAILRKYPAIETAPAGKDAANPDQYRLLFEKR